MTADAAGSLLIGLATLVTSVTGLIVARGAKRGVDTLNGLTGGALQERAEGRRILADIPEVDRTPGEQGYVDRLADPQTNPGQSPR